MKTEKPEFKKDNIDDFIKDAKADLYAKRER